jgi:hypothetical protein
MSECDDDVLEWTCPCLLVNASQMNVFAVSICMGWNQDGSPGETVENCPYAPILKLLAEAEEVSHFSIDEKLDEIEGGGWEVVEFWIRR